MKPLLPNGTRFLTMRESVASLMGPLRCWRLALIGAEPMPPETVTCKSGSEDVARLVAQARDAYQREGERTAENRRRSEELFTRVATALPLVGGLVGVLLTSSTDHRVDWWAGVASGALACTVLAVALLAISRNLGRTAQYEAVNFGDLVRGKQAGTAFPDHKLVEEYLTATLWNERNNNVAITRLHFSHAAFVVALAPLMLSAVLTGVAVGRTVLAASGNAFQRAAKGPPSTEDAAAQPLRAEPTVPPAPVFSLRDAAPEPDGGTATVAPP